MLFMTFKLNFGFPGSAFPKMAAVGQGKTNMWAACLQVAAFPWGSHNQRGQALTFLIILIHSHTLYIRTTRRYSPDY